MSDQQNVEPAQDVEPTTPVADAAADESVPAADAEPFDAPRAQALIAKLRQEVRDQKAEAKKKAGEAAQAGDLSKQIDELTAKVAPLEAAKLRLEVALECGLSTDVAKRLVGNTREELLADAESLVALLTPKGAATKTVRPVESLQPGSGASQTGAPAQLSRADLASMTPAQIESARAAGQLADLMAGKST